MGFFDNSIPFLKEIIKELKVLNTQLIAINREIYEIKVEVQFPKVTEYERKESQKNPNSSPNNPLRIPLSKIENKSFYDYFIKRGISLHKFAEECKICPPTLKKVLMNKPVTLSTAEKIQAATGNLLTLKDIVVKK